MHAIGGFLGFLDFFENKYQQDTTQVFKDFWIFNGLWISTVILLDLKDFWIFENEFQQDTTHVSRIFGFYLVFGFQLIISLDFKDFWIL